MHDPFFIPPIPWLSRAVQPFSDYFSLTTLPLHIHEVLASFFLYTFINLVIAPWISKLIFPVSYAKLSTDRRINWDVHVVSLFQSTMINALALWIMFTDEERKNMNWMERVWGYTGGAGMIQGLAAGYFLWDLMITIQHVKLFGYGMLAHAVSALTVFSFGFRPFLNYYGCTFILYELSSPFLNFHWFFDKLDMTGSKAQLYNGLALIFTFFWCRLVWGTYQSVLVYQDVWAAFHHKPVLNNGTTPSHNDIMQFAGQEHVPLWLGFTYLASNLVLNSLNFYWFGAMIDAVKKRFKPAKGSGKKEKAVVSRSTGVDGKMPIEAEETEVRKRNFVADEIPAVS